MNKLLDYLMPPVPKVFNPAQNRIDEQAVWAAALKVSQVALQDVPLPSVSFDYGPVCIVNTADWHMGSEGTDYQRFESEAQIIRDTPGMYLGMVGDALDNFIIGKLAMLRIDSTRFRVSEEWALVKHGLGLVASKLIYVVDGNHDQWTHMVSGIDYFGEVVEHIRPGVVYANDELSIDIIVGATPTRFRMRHKWKGTSIYNDTHGIERAAKFDKGRSFDVGVAAHTHASGLSREFNNGGKTGLAQLCGSYKRQDRYAKRVGFPQANEATAVATVIDENGIVFGTNNLHGAAAYMRTMYRGDNE